MDMHFLKQLNLSQQKILKLTGLGIIVLVILAFVIRLFSSSFSSFMPLRQMMATGGAGVASPGYEVYGDAAEKVSAPMMASLSTRNIAPIPPTAPGSVGGDAEAFEVTRYTGAIETRHLKETCGRIVELKAREYIVFEQANESDHRCEYAFKVERAHVDEVLARVKELQPKELSENIQTIKQQLDDFTSEKDILEKKRASIEKTLGDAIQSYEEIAAIATRAQDAESLAKIIESKLQIIERLTQERLSINEQLDRMDRAKSQQLDGIAYTHFSLSVYENAFVDTQVLKDSWKETIKAFVYDINRVAQDVTVNLIALLFFAAQYLLYFFILLLVMKYVWRAAKYIWKS